MNKIRVLFICVHNSARSQMAEAFLNHLAGEEFEAESAGLQAGVLNPLAVQAMKEVGIDISRNKTKSVDEMVQAGSAFDYVITVCDETSVQRCPIFPGAARRIHWSFEDPSGFQGSYQERLEKTRKIRDQIKRKVESWIKERKGITD